MDNHATGNLILSDPRPRRRRPDPGRGVGPRRRGPRGRLPDDRRHEPARLVVRVHQRPRRRRPRRPRGGGASRQARPRRATASTSRCGSTCEIGVHLERVVAPERGPRHKWTDVGAVDRFVRAHDLVDVDGPRHRHDPPASRAVGRGDPGAPRATGTRAHALSSSRQIGGSSGLLKSSLVSTMPIWASTGSVYQSLPRPPLHP